MSTSSRSRTLVHVVAVALVFSALGWGGMVSSAMGHELRPADDCGYSGCHDGAPVPGTETSAAVETTCVPGKPSVSGKLRVRKTVRVSGSLTPTSSVATTITVYYERKVGKRYRAWSHVDVSVAAAATTYVTRPKFPKRGAWRVRAVHVEVSGDRSTSAWRNFNVR